MSKNNLSLSFEFFPPKTNEGLLHLQETCRILRCFNPNFFTVTFGASGNNQSPTFQTVNALKKQLVNVHPHLTCIGLSHNDILEHLHSYKQLGITTLVVLRGDLVTNAKKSSFEYASELIQFIRKETGDYFEIIVAAYPEFHPQAANIECDLDNLKRKIDAGASRAITQFFYNTDAYFYYLETCAKHHIHIPITPGVMPIQNFSKLLRFSRGCHAEIPQWIRKYTQTFHHQEDIDAFGIRFITDLCKRLLQGGAPGLHFYTLNHAEPTYSIINQLNLNGFRCGGADNYTLNLKFPINQVNEENSDVCVLT